MTLKKVGYDFGEGFRPLGADRVAGIVHQTQDGRSAAIPCSDGPSRAGSPGRASRTAPASACRAGASPLPVRHHGRGRAAARPGAAALPAPPGRSPAAAACVPDGRRAGPPFARACRKPARRPVASGRIAAGASSTSARTRSGCCIASHSAALPPNEVPIRLNRSRPSASAAFTIVAASSGDRAGPRVLLGLAEPRHLERDDAELPGQQIVRGVEAQTAGAVQMHERRPLPRLAIADAEPVRLDKPLAEGAARNGTVCCWSDT